MCSAPAACPVQKQLNPTSLAVLERMKEREKNRKQLEDGTHPMYRPTNGDYFNSEYANLTDGN